MVTDAQIEHEVETYNQLIPDRGELSGTLFLEIDDKARLYEWLPRLVGIQRAVAFGLGDGAAVRSVPDDEERLTREDVTSSVHDLKFGFTTEQGDLLRAGPASIVVDHEHYEAEATLTDEQRAELADDLSA